MSVFPADEPDPTGNGATKREGLWQRLVLAVDAYFAERAKKAIPAVTVRRSKHEIARCRRLMHCSISVPLQTLKSRDVTQTKNSS